MEVDRPIAIAVILFVILFVAFYLVVPKYQEFEEFQIKLSKKEAEYRGRSAYFSDIASTYEKLKQKEEILKKIDSALPSSPALHSLVYFLQKKSLENGLIFLKANLLKISPIKEGSRIKETNFSFGVVGPYPAFKNFLMSLEKSARLIEVEDVSFVARKEFEETFEFNVTVKVYSY